MWRSAHGSVRRIAGATAALAAALAVAGAGGMTGPPESPRGTQVDDYHGQRVADPYRWLEQTDTATTRRWIEAQNAWTRQHLDELPSRARFATQLRRLLDHERRGLPQQEGGRLVYTRNSGMQEQDTLWVSDDPADPGHLLLDPNTLSADGTISLHGYELAPDGRHLAYALSDGGSDWNSWRIREIGSGADLPEVLSGTKFTGIAWRPDGSGFFYSRYPARPGMAAGPAAAHQAAGGGWDDDRQVSIWYHALGTAQAADLPVFSIRDHAARDPYPQVSDDGAWLLIHVEEGYRSNGVYYQALAAEPSRQAMQPVVRLLDRWDGLYDFLGNAGPVFYFRTTAGAPAGRVVAVDTRRPAPENWRTVVPEREDAIADASMAGGRLFVQYLVDVHSRVSVFGLDGKALGDVVLPGTGMVDGFDGHAGDPETFFSYTDYTTPRTIYRYGIASGRTTIWHAPAAGIDPGAYQARQVWFTSRDGTRVPMTIIARRDLPLDQPRATVLYGYGGFNVSLLPAYSAARAAWLESGGVYVVANLRGGGEFGERWHEAGTRLTKQNVFDDFIAAAEWLIASGVTSRRQLAIFGGSNGGLLVGAVLNQRPDLFAAAVPAVGVMDMLRYPLASANARQWSSDYGLAEVPGEFHALHAYSPYHNLRSGICYPPTLVMADANDDRVAPWHSYKYAAALQAAQDRASRCNNPVLIRIETRAGHGAGASTSKLIDEYADQWAFVAAATGLIPPADAS